jgi:hypothetical protein
LLPPLMGLVVPPIGTRELHGPAIGAALPLGIRGGGEVVAAFDAASLDHAGRRLP